MIALIEMRERLAALASRPRQHGGQAAPAPLVNPRVPTLDLFDF